MLHPRRQRQYAAQFKCQHLQWDPGSFIHVGWVTHSMLVVEHGAGFVSLPSVLTIHFLLQQRAEVNGLKPKLMQGCVHVHEAEDKETTQHADIVVTGQTPSICSGSMGSLCAHFSVHCTPTGSSCSVRCLCVKKVWKKKETPTWHLRISLAKRFPWKRN